jgi:hypothetical protein
MQHNGVMITHFIDFTGIVMSTWRYLPNARMWKIKATGTCDANGIHYKQHIEKR